MDILIIAILCISLLVYTPDGCLDPLVQEGIFFSLFSNQTKQITAASHDAPSGPREISLIILFPLLCKIPSWNWA